MGTYFDYLPNELIYHLQTYLTASTFTNLITVIKRFSLLEFICDDIYALIKYMEDKKERIEKYICKQCCTLFYDYHGYDKNKPINMKRCSSCKDIFCETCTNNLYKIKRGARWIQFLCETCFLSSSYTNLIMDDERTISLHIVSY